VAPHEEASGIGVVRPGQRRWRLAVLASMVVIGLGAILAWSASKIFHSELVVRTCFQDAEGLRAGAAVRIAGVDVGRVRVVRAQPENHSCPAHVEIFLSTPYQLKISSDSIATTQTAGILGETYVEIDSSRATGPAIAMGGELKSRAAEHLTAKEWLDRLEKISKGLCEAENDTKGAHSSKP